MLSIRPGSTFPIVRQIADPTDSATYYVRAVVRDSVTGDTIATVDLVDQGNQRFTYNYPAPSDGSGFGRYIDVTTTVYSDSGYTTRTGIYADENQTYMVKENEVHLGFGGGGADVDYKKIRTILKELLDEHEKMEMPEIPEQKDITPAINALETRILGAINGIEIPQPEKIDLTDVISKVDEAINTLLIAVDSKEVTPETDITPVLSQIESLPVRDIVEKLDEIRDTFAGMSEAIGWYSSSERDELDTLRSSAQQFMSTAKKPKKQEEQEDPYVSRARRLLGNPQTA